MKRKYHGGTRLKLINAFILSDSKIFMQPRYCGKFLFSSLTLPFLLWVNLLHRMHFINYTRRENLHSILLPIKCRVFTYFFIFLNVQVGRYNLPLTQRLTSRHAVLQWQWGVVIKISLQRMQFFLGGMWVGTEASRVMGAWTYFALHRFWKICVCCLVCEEKSYIIFFAKIDYPKKGVAVN